ncbi:peptide-methionine (R)-S-oxide reductase MsrB [Paraglaciecola aquimarina]|uniref:peptide-methionine (R)-S-oxide reductase n=1 Tax=Paraglaciecola aquimarina TaxID=1235557 RepID=A0ABU3SZU2_9ALTE|nr:peptide-methionine (R)-S-oxide reductase MsrB [Paraglaciecola aquimarina]MDU0355534.1 peptide-methionine (R)-S-oxide reductase MsrB [Paraglaciecola aquimarina]
MKLSNEQWRQKLTDEEYRVCREKGTERPFTGKLLDETGRGEYVCTCCNSKLFDSTAKYDSGCGWPSFSAQSDEQNVEYHADDSLAMQRVEIVCKHCDAHLGHVFDDGPQPSGKRYCVNSVSLQFSAK